MRPRPSLVWLLAALSCVGAKDGGPKPADSAATASGDSTPSPTETDTGPPPPPCEPVTEGSVWVQDQDGDCVQGLLDCDDLDPEVNLAEEVCDGKDNDCNGVVDDGVLLTWFLDVDGDGYASEEVETCSMPEPWLTGESLGVDCDDADATIHPEDPWIDAVMGIEIPGDGVDQDCDGADACGPVCVGWDCGFSTTEEAEAFCATYGQAAYVEFLFPGPDLSVLDCLCAPPEEVVIGVTEGESPNLSGLESWFPTEELRVVDTVWSGWGGTFSFPGLEGVTEIPATIVVQCQGNEYTPFDIHFTGLSNVERLGGLVFGDRGYGCYNSDTAVDLSGLDRLRVIDGDLYFYDTQFQSLHGLEALEEVGGDLILHYVRDPLFDISALSGLRRVGGSLYGNAEVDLTPLAGLEEVGGSFALRGDIPEFESLRQVGGLSLTGVPSAALAQFSWVRELPYGFGIQFLDGATLPGLGQVTSMGLGLYVGENPGLINLEGLGALAVVDRTVWLENNAVLTDLTGLSSLTTIGYHMWIKSNPALTSLTGVSALTTIGSTLEVTSNPSLTSLTGLSALTDVGNDLTIVDNDVLTSLDGLSSLTDVGGSVWLEANPDLDLDAPVPLARVDAHMVLLNNSSLTTLDGLSSLRRVGGTLYIANNDQLRSLEGLYGLTYVGGDVWFQGNRNLSEAEIYAFLDHLGRENIGLKVIIE